VTKSNVRKVTGAQVAARLGLSTATVSLVLSGRSERYGISKSTVDRVKAEVERMDYRPNVAARQLLGKRSGAVGVLINTKAMADPRLIQKMEMLAAERDIRFIVGHAVSTSERVKDYLDDFCARGVDGLIAIFHNHPDYRETVARELSRFEHVVYYERPSGASVDSTVFDACYVQPDFCEAGRLAVQHLIERGHRRVALVLDTMVFPYGEAWRRGYENALLAAGQPVEDRLMWVMDQRLSVPWTDPFTAERALRAVDEMVIEGGADGVVTCRDSHASRIMAALRQRGRRVPDDVAVVGCGDLEIGTMIEPQLTTVDLGVDELAGATVGLLFELIDRGSVPEERRAVVVRPELIVRSST